MPRATVAKTEAKEARIEVNIFSFGCCVAKTPSPKPKSAERHPRWRSQRTRSVPPGVISEYGLESPDNMGWKALTKRVGKPGQRNKKT